MKSLEPLSPPVAWLLHGPPSVASSRLQGYLVHEFLQRRGERSELLMAPPLVFPDAPWGEDTHDDIHRCFVGHVLVFQKLFGENARALAAACRSAGIATVYVHCDYQPENPLPLECDAIVCPSEYLAKKYREAGAEAVYRLDDPSERWCDRGAITGVAVRPDKLRLCWVGVKHNWPTLDGLREVLRREDLADFELITVSDHPDATVPWSLEGVWDVIQSCDIGVIPIGEGPAAYSKSSNRLVQFMAAGKPVIVGALPAYQALLENGRNGFVCRTAEQWVSALRELRSAALRREMALRAYDTVDPRFRIETVGQQWLKVFAATANPGASGPEPTRASGVRVPGLRASLEVRAQLAYQQAADQQHDRVARARALRSATGQLVKSPQMVSYYMRAQRRMLAPRLRRAASRAWRAAAERVRGGGR